MTRYDIQIEKTSNNITVASNIKSEVHLWKSSFSIIRKIAIFSLG